MAYFGRIAARDVPHAPQKGVTIGGWDADFTGSDERVFSEAVNALGPDGGTITVINGRFDFRSAPVINKRNVRFMGSRAVTLVPAHGGAVGLFDVRAEGFLLQGCTIRIETFVANQKVISGTGADWAMVHKNHFVVAATGGVGANAMDLVSFATGIEAIVSGNSVLPAAGIRAFRFTTVSGLRVFNNTVRTETADGTPARDCWEVMRSSDCSLVQVMGNRVYGLGTLTTSELNGVFIIQGRTGNISDYFEYTKNLIHDVASPRQLEIFGIIDYLIEGCFFGNAKGAVAVDGEAAVYIDSDTGADLLPPNEDGITGVGRFSNCILESCATGTGNAINIVCAKKVNFAGMNFHLPTNGPQYIVQLNVRQARVLTVSESYFDGTAGTTLGGIQVAWTPASGLVNPQGVILGPGNVGNGLSYGLVTGREPLAFQGYPATRPTFHDGTVHFASAISAGTRQPILDNTGVNLGGVVNAIPAMNTYSGTAPGSSTYTLAVMAQALNRLVQGQGCFQLNIAMDPGDGAATNGTIDAITATFSTFEDAVREWLVKYNEVVDAFDTLAGHQKIWKTIVNGAGTAGAFAKLVDNSGGTPDLTGALGTGTTFGTAANGIATLNTWLGLVIDYLRPTSNITIPTAANL